MLSRLIGGAIGAGIGGALGAGLGAGVGAICGACVIPIGMGFIFAAPFAGSSGAVPVAAFLLGCLVGAVIAATAGLPLEGFFTAVGAKFGAVSGAISGTIGGAVTGYKHGLPSISSLFSSIKDKIAGLFTKISSRYSQENDDSMDYHPLPSDEVKSQSTQHIGRGLSVSPGSFVPLPDASDAHQQPQLDEEKTIRLQIRNILTPRGNDLPIIQIDPKHIGILKNELDEAKYTQDEINLILKYCEPPISTTPETDSWLKSIKDDNYKELEAFVATIPPGDFPKIEIMPGSKIIWEMMLKKLNYTDQQIALIIEHATLAQSKPADDLLTPQVASDTPPQGGSLKSMSI